MKTELKPMSRQVKSVWFTHQFLMYVCCERTQKNINKNHDIKNRYQQILQKPYQYLVKKKKYKIISAFPTSQIARPVFRRAEMQDWQCKWGLHY